MREIKFRGKDIESDVWFVGSYLEQYTKSSGWSVIGAHIARKVRVEGGIAVLTNEVDPDTVGEYRFTNTNDQQCFDGDILEDSDGRLWRLVGLVEVEDRWVLAVEVIDSGNKYAVDKSILRMDRIGNIHDNPDLIK